MNSRIHFSMNPRSKLPSFYKFVGDEEAWPSHKSRFANFLTLHDYPAEKQANRASVANTIYAKLRDLTYLPEHPRESDAKANLRSVA